MADRAHRGGDRECEAKLRKLKISEKLEVKGETHLRDTKICGHLSVDGKAGLCEALVRSLKFCSASGGKLDVKKLEAVRAKIEEIKAKSVITDSIVTKTLEAALATIEKLVAHCVEADTVCFPDRAAPPTPKAGLNCLYVVDAILQYLDENGNTFTVDVTPNNPFYGYWAVANQSGDSTGDTAVTSTLFFIDTTALPYLVNSYSGPPGQYRELAPASENHIFPEIYGQTPFLPDPADPTSLLMVPGFFFGPNILSLKLQPDGKSIVAFVAPSTFSQGGEPWGLYLKIPKPPIRPYGPTDLTFPDPNNPVFMFEEYCRYLLTEHPVTNNSLGYDLYPGYSAFEKRHHDLLTTGVSYSQPVVAMQRSLNPPLTISPAFPITTVTTTIFLKNSIKANPGMSKVTFSGFAPPYDALLNGKTFIVQFLQTIIMEDREATPGFVSQIDNGFCFTVALDTSDLPADEFGYLPDLGSPMVVNVVDPVTPGSGYRELMNAIMDITQFAMVYSTHTAIFFYLPAVGENLQLFETFEELNSNLFANSLLLGTGLRFPTVPASGIYSNASTYIGPIDPFMVPINNPFRFLPVPGNLWDYNVPLQNYLQPGSARNLYWTLQGPAVTLNQQEAGLAYLGDPTIGAQFVSSLQPYGTAPPTGIWYLLGASTPGFDPGDGQIFFVGLIKPEFTGGKLVGYIRFNNYDLIDALSFMASADFNPPSAPPSARTNYESLMSVFAPAFQYLNSLGVTSVIINQASNTGGSPVVGQAIPQFFGATRQAQEFRMMPQADSGFSPLIDPLSVETVNDAYNVSVEIPFTTLDSDLTEQLYPGSVFRGGKVIILSDLDSVSAADAFPRYFLGDALDKNIGANTTVQFFGELSGRLIGATGTIFYPTTSATRFRLQFDGIPIIPYIALFENNGVGAVKLTAEPGFTNNTVPQLAMDSDASGTFPPGPWDNTFEKTVYPDYGFVPPIYPPLPGDTRDPPNSDPSNQSLFRFVWLEVAIRNALL